MTDRRVLMIAPNFPPIVAAGVFRTLRFAKCLPELGWQPLVVSGKPLGEQPDCRLEVPAEVVVRRVTWRTAPECGPSAPPQDGTVHKPQNVAPPVYRRAAEPAIQTLRNFKRLMSETPDRHRSWGRDAVRAGLELIQSQHPDVLYTTGPPHSVHLVGRRLKRETGLPWVADFRDPWSRAPWGAKPSNPWAYRLLPYFERACVTAADRVVLNTPRLADDFRAAYPHMADKFLSITNGWDPDFAERVPRLLAEAQGTRTGGPVVLCHPGTCYRERDPRPLVQAVKLAAEGGTDVLLRQVGLVSPKLHLDEFFAENDLSGRVELVGTVPHGEALAHMAAADILVLLQPGTPLQVPGKLFEMLLFGKPILAVCEDGETADIVRRYRLGAVASPHDPKAIAAAVRELVIDRSAYTNHSGWSDALRDYDGRELTARLAAVFNELAGRPAAPLQHRPVAAAAS